MMPASRIYKCAYRVSRLAVGMFYRLVFVGKENIPDGAAMICANHSSSFDPFFLVFAFGNASQIHIIAKAELFRIPVLSAVLRKLGMICVDRSISDVSTIRTSLGYLKKGEKVAIFPEGTRVSADDAVSAKNGAVRLAERADVPIVPVYIPRKKKLFRKNVIVIGAPYYIVKSAEKRQTAEYAVLAHDLMNRIKLLNPENREA